MLIKDKPEYCFSSGCPLARCKCGHALDEHHATGTCPCGCERFESLGKGFVLGSGDPYTSKMMFILETPETDEVQFYLLPVPGRNFFETSVECNNEIARRRKSYPYIDEKLLRKGAPLVGKSGVELDMWVLPVIGVQRKDVFIDNTLRCLPPKQKDGKHYPTGDIRKHAEKCCRKYDRLEQFRPDAMVITLHPNGILREVTPLPLQVKDFEKGRDFVRGGRRVAMLLGGKSAKAFLRYGENVTKFRGDYRLLPFDYVKTYKDKFVFVTKKDAKKKQKKLDVMETLFDFHPGTEELPKVKFTRRKKVSNAGTGTDGTKPKRKPRSKKGTDKGSAASQPTLFS